MFQGEAQMEAGQWAVPDLLLTVKTSLDGPVHAT